MPEEPFKNREILSFFAEIKDQLIDIKKDTSEHNHRMTKLEDRNLVITTTLRVLSGIITLIIIPLLFHFLKI